jgi:hypothetical protein
MREFPGVEWERLVFIREVTVFFSVVLQGATD